MSKTASLSEEVLDLVSTVERLAAEDQERILRIVSLLTRVPSAAQQETQRMLKALIDRNPRSMFDCVHGVDEVIEYLENCMVAKRVTRQDQFYCRPVSRQRN
jgi:recombinational DNA repair protein RecR